MPNRVLLIGRLAGDPELKYTQSGVPVATFRLAVERTPMGDAKPTTEKQTDFVDIVCWRHNAEFANKYLVKGRLTLVEGRLQVREYTTPTGQRKAVEVVVETLRPLDKPVGDTEPSESG